MNPSNDTKGAETVRQCDIRRGAEFTFAGYDGQDYRATIMGKLRCGFVRVGYCVRGLGVITPAVAINRLKRLAA